MQIFKELIQPGDLCFDIGANIGVYSQALLNAGANVIAVEPNPECIEKLKLINDKHMTIIQKAVSDKKGTSSLYIHEGKTNISTLNRRYTSIDNPNNVLWKSIEVQTITLNDLIETYGIPKFCKIDVEGHESKILFAYSLSQIIPVICFEFSIKDFENFRDSIISLSFNGNFIYNFTINNNETFILDNWTRPKSIDLMEKEIINSGGLWGNFYIKYTSTNYV